MANPTESLVQNCKVALLDDALCLFAPDAETVQVLKRHAQQLASHAMQFGRNLCYLYEPGRERPYQIDATWIRNTSQSEPIEPAEPFPVDTPDPASSYAPSRIDPDASYDAVEDFVRGMKASGKIVTIMSMNDKDPSKNDLFLKVNDLQIQHRAGGWKMNEWVGTDAKSTVWVRSFDGTLPRAEGRPTGHNYYSELVGRIRSGETFIQDYFYLIDRPNRAGLWADLTDYHFVRDYGGCAIRIAVSDPQNSTLIESYEVAA